MKKSAQIVMLPTNEKALNLTPIVMYNNKLFSCYSGNYSYDKAIFQNLYILSDEEIKEGDWVCKGTEIWQVKSYYGFQPITKKIIATTDKSLFTETKAIAYTEDRARVFYGKEYLPQPSTLFIEKFVEEYNKGNVITEVEVEYEYDSYSTKTNGELTADLKLKINPDNTIDINMPKDSWSREEVTTLLYSLNRDKEGNFDCTKWIEENL